MKFQSEILYKYLKGKFSLKDKAVVDSYFSDDQFAPELDKALKDHWEATFDGQVEEEADFERILDRINHRILLFKTQTSTLSRAWQYYSKIAAIFLIPFILGASIYFIQSKNEQNSMSWVEVHSPLGARTQISLPDGSTCWLNSGATVKYPAQFNEQRKISLNGEAYFDVVKNPESPFVVKAKNINVRVLGTSFDVVAYDADSVSEVIVARGVVQVTSRDNGVNERLLPSDRLVFNSLRNTSYRSKVDVFNYTSWKSGRLVFMNDNLTETIRKISRFFNVEIRLEGKVDRGQLFRAIIDNESVEEVLEYMKYTMDIDYVIHERKPDSTGRISKKEIIITHSVKK